MRNLGSPYSLREGETVEIPPFGKFVVGKISAERIDLHVPKDDPRFGKLPVDLWLNRWGRDA